MCGIIGYIGDYNLEHALNGLQKIAHRGPDGQGTWEDEGIFLGHRRLSIIDLSNQGHQPMELLDRYIITFNGEIYNYLEIKKELELTGYKFRGHSDTEVLLYAYIHWGKKMIGKLNGMWAFAIWDKSEKSLFMSRDRLGKKPLFYSIPKSTEIAFSSEMKGLNAILGKRPSIDHHTVELAKANSFSYEATEHCLLEGILRFPAGSNGYWKAGKLEIEKYWHPLEEISDVPEKYSEQVEMFRELFLDACKIRMRSDVTIGTALSGGLDSSATICAMAYLAKQNSQQIQKDWQHAFVASFPNVYNDESSYAKIVTDHLGIQADFVEINPVKDIEDIFRQTYLFEEIYYAPTLPFVSLYGRVKEKGVTVSIDGHGADELFAGYPTDMDKGLIDAIPSISKFRDVQKTIEQAKHGQQLTPTLEYLKFALANRYPILGQFARSTKTIDKIDGLGYLNSVLFGSTYHTILPTLLRNYDRYSMINGVEIRMPFLDYRILNFAFSIPFSSKIRGGYSKAIVREALQDFIPKEVVWRKDKIGFNAPMDNWLGGKLQTWIQDEMNSQSFKNAETIQSESVKKDVSAYLKKDNMNFLEASAIFEKLTPYIWEKSLNTYSSFAYKK